MKLVFIVDRYPPLTDGVGDYTYNLVNEYCRRGNKVSVICFKDEKIETAPESGATVFPIVAKWNSNEFKKVTKLVNDLKPDWVLLQYVPHSYQKKGMPVWLPSALKHIDRKNTKLSIRIHEPFIRLQFWPSKILFLGLVQRWIIKQLGAQADKIVASTDLYKKFVDAYSTTKTEVVPIGSNILPVDTPADSIQRTRLKVAPNGEKIISTFGIRDHQLLIKVFELVLQKNPDFKLLVCGVVKNKDIYRAIEKSVFITGFVSSPEVYTYLTSSDIFFIPDEVTPNGMGGSSNKSTAIAAGFSANLPVIGIKGDMNNELLSRNKALYLEDGNDASSIADRIIEVVLHREYNNESYKFWQEYLSWDKIVDAYNVK